VLVYIVVVVSLVQGFCFLKSCLLCLSCCLSSFRSLLGCLILFYLVMCFLLFLLIYSAFYYSMKLQCSFLGHKLEMFVIGHLTEFSVWLSII